MAIRLVARYSTKIQVLFVVFIDESIKIRLAQQLNRSGEHRTDQLVCRPYELYDPANLNGVNISAISFKTRTPS